MSWTIGVSTGGCTELPITTVIEEAAAAGIFALELGTPPRHFAPWDADQVAAVGAQVRGAGLGPISLHAPFGGVLDLSDPNPRHREATVAAVLTAADALAAVGGSLVVVHPSDAVRHAHQVDRRLDMCATALWQLDAGCRQRGLTLVLESPLRHLVGGERHEFARLLHEGPPGLRVCLDTGHLTLGRQWEEFLELAGDRLVHVHASDHHGHHDDHLPPGDGLIDWRWIVQTLRTARFDGVVMLEMRCCSHLPLRDYFSRAREQFHAFCA